MIVLEQNISLTVTSMTVLVQQKSDSYNNVSPSTKYKSYSYINDSHSTIKI